MKFIKSVVVFAIITSCVSISCGQSVTVSGGGNNATFDATFYPVSAEAIADDESLLAGSVTFDFTVSTGSDIVMLEGDGTFNSPSLSLLESYLDTSGMNVPGGWYNHLAQFSRSDVESDGDNRDYSGFAPFVPSLAADSWITSPGRTLDPPEVCPDAIGVPCYSPIGDLTDDGPQTDFNFARITLIPDANGNASATFRGTLETAGSPGPIFDDFEFNFSLNAVPEPDSCALVLLALFGLSLFRSRR